VQHHEAKTMKRNHLEIVTLNGKASIQDLGRLNAQHLGFSVSGAADEYAYRYANKLIADHQSQITASNKNKQQACAALEITLGQITLRANAACTIAITGADCQVQLNKNTISNWQCYQIQADDIIDFAMPKNGLHSYLAILGGLKLAEKQQPWLDSFAQTDNEMALDVLGKKLIVGSKLFFPRQILPSTMQCQQKCHRKVVPSALYKPNAPELFYPQQQLTLRFIASALFLQLPIEKQQTFLANQYAISPDSNRMGYRLVLKEKPILTNVNKILPTTLRADCVLSKPVTYGMIQLPENEQPIVLMKERQTMGGYPVLGSVMQTDLFRLSQMRPGQKISFSLINYQLAQQQLQAFYQKF
jgi:biotin-dependent carboxylase-like uncharacterized protein